MSSGIGQRCETRTERRSGDGRGMCSLSPVTNMRNVHSCLIIEPPASLSLLAGGLAYGLWLHGIHFKLHVGEFLGHVNREHLRASYRVPVRADAVEREVMKPNSRGDGRGRRRSVRQRYAGERRTDYPVNDIARGNFYTAR